MDARKLCYGDLVKNHKWILAFNGISSRDGQLEALYLDREHPASGILAMVDDESIQPILITPEFLDKNFSKRFKGVQDRECWQNDILQVSVDVAGYYRVQNLDYTANFEIDGDIKWVHELQSVMRLLGFMDMANSLNV